MLWTITKTPNNFFSQVYAFIMTVCEKMKSNVSGPTIKLHPLNPDGASESLIYYCTLLTPDFQSTKPGCEMCTKLGI